MTEITADPALARKLVLDELFDLSLYQALQRRAPPHLRAILDELIPVETRHLAFWQDLFGLRLTRLDLGRRLQLGVLVAVCRTFGAPAMHLVLEAIEVYGVRKYLRVWDAYRDSPLGAAIGTILEDEFQHEDTLVTGEAARRINPERVRNIFLGLNDGLVEILGAVSGFFAAFGASITVLVAGLTVAVAGALSMAAGAWIGVSSESEVRATERERRLFLDRSASPSPSASDGGSGDSPMASALFVGTSYFAGALVPVLPVLAGARTPVPSILAAGTLIVAVSAIVAFLSGMDARRRVLMNLAIIAGAVTVSFAIGHAARLIWGVSL